MFAEFRTHARYWGFLLGKLVAATLLAALVLWILNLFWMPRAAWFHLNRRQFIYDLGYTTLAGAWFLITYGLYYLAFWDQRYRCRTCLRRLLMPVETGSWSYMLQMGRPQVEYICPYGHGTLNIDEVQITGNVTPGWTENGDMWSELFATTKGPDKD